MRTEGMIAGFFRQTDDILRRRPWTTQSAQSVVALGKLAATLVVFSMIYGAVMGSFAGVGGERNWHLLYVASKVPLLLLTTSLICLPSFFVCNTLFGLRSDFSEAVRALAATQAGLAIILASLAPLTGVWYATSSDYGGAVLFNAMIFAVASFGAQGLLRGFYRPLIARNARHVPLLWIWMGIYAFVGIQMGWVLRPFIGDPNAPVQFFREGAWSNAYVVVIRLVCDAIGR